MPLVRISMMKDKPKGFSGEVGRIVYEVMLDATAGLDEVKKENWSFGNGIAQYVAPEQLVTTQ